MAIRLRGTARIATALMGAIALVALLMPVGHAGAGGVATFEVTFTNLTSGQPLTPPVVATHSENFQVWKVRREARFGVQQIAENGNNAPLLTFLERRSRVFDVVQGGGGPLLPPGTAGGGTFPDAVTFEITASDDAHSLSLVSMLVCTNDGFTGVDRLSLPAHVGGTTEYEAAAYDARTERNTQNLRDIVPPCQPLIGVTDDHGKPGTDQSNPALRTNGVVRHHRGIADRADLLPGVHGWTDPVAMIEIERIV